MSEPRTPTVASITVDMHGRVTPHYVSFPSEVERAQARELLDNLTGGEQSQMVDTLVKLCQVYGPSGTSIIMETIERINTREEEVRNMEKPSLTSALSSGASFFSEQFNAIDEANRVLHLAWDDGYFDDCFQFEKNPILMGDLGAAQGDKMIKAAQELLAGAAGLRIVAHPGRWGILRKDGVFHRPKRPWVRAVAA